MKVAKYFLPAGSAQELERAVALRAVYLVLIDSAARAGDKAIDSERAPRSPSE